MTGILPLNRIVFQNATITKNDKWWQVKNQNRHCLIPLRLSLMSRDFMQRHDG